MEGIECDIVFGVVKFDVFELREDVGFFCYYIVYMYKVVEVRLVKLVKGVVNGKVKDVDVNFGVDMFVIGVM